jgi:hypothetical protein
MEGIKREKKKKQKAKSGRQEEYANIKRNKKERKMENN